MEILDRYLQAVRKFLPWQRQDDIIAELRANMESQLEDAEAERGRPLSKVEVEELLKKMGRPMLVASRYQPQRSLIGPMLFPIYWYVLRMALLWVCIIYVIAMVIVAPLTSSQAVNAVDSLLRLPVVLFYTAGWVTLVFVAMEFIASRYPEKCPALGGLVGTWDPASLPPIERNGQSAGKQRSFVHAVAEVVFGFLALAWMALIPKYPYLLLGPGAFVLDASPFQLSHAWWTFYWWILALNMVQVTWRLMDLIRGAWRQPRRMQTLVIKSMGIIPLGLMLAVANHAYALLRHPEANATKYGSTLETINKSVHLGLMVVLAIAGLQLLWDIAQAMLGGYRKRAAAR